jgi:AraC-like DNA-binding protein
MTHYKSDHFGMPDHSSAVRRGQLRRTTDDPQSVADVVVPAAAAAARELIAIVAQIGGGGPSLPANADTLSLKGFSDFYGEWLSYFYPRLRPGYVGLSKLREEFRLIAHCLVGAGTLGEALVLQRRYTQVFWNDLCEIEWHDTGDTLDIVCRMGLAPSAATFVHDVMALSITLCEFEWLVGGPLEGATGRVQSPLLIAPETARMLFAAPLTHGAAETALSIPKRHLDRPIVRRAGDIDAFFDRLPLSTLAGWRAAPDLQASVAAILRKELLNSASAATTLTRVAASLSLNDLTLRRRLRHAGYSFRAIREDVIDEFAKSCLATQDLTIDAVAERVGYSDANAFRRSFQRRNGLSPSAYRGGQRRK